MYSFSYLEPVCCSMSSSSCCFPSCIQISQEAGQVLWYSHLFQNFPQFIGIHTVKGFGIVNKAEINVFMELSCFFYDPADVGNLISGSSAFFKSGLNIVSSHLKYCCSMAWRNLIETLSNGQIWLWSTKLSRKKTERFCQENDLCSFSRQNIQYHGNKSLCPD